MVCFKKYRGLKRGKIQEKSTGNTASTTGQPAYSHDKKAAFHKKAYCRRNNIPLTSFGSWKRKINIGFVEPSSFIELKGHFPAHEEYFELQAGFRMREQRGRPCFYGFYNYNIFMFGVYFCLFFGYFYINY